MGVFLSCLRYAVCLVVLICGTKFLLKTHTNAFLLLNSVKLMLIMQVSQLIVGVAPYKSRGLILTMMPLPCRAPNTWKGVDFFSVMKLSALAVWLGISSYWLAEE